jgi:hypothetical protein
MPPSPDAQPVHLRNLQDTATLRRAGTTPHPKRSPTMHIIRSGSQAPVKGPADYFTGEVTIEWQFSRDDPARLIILRVFRAFA